MKDNNNTVDLTSPENSFALMVVCECIGEDVTKLCDVAENAKDANIEFKVNGHELDFTKFITLLRDNYYDYVEQEAKTLLKNQFEEIQSKAIDIAEKLEYIHIELDKEV